MELYLPSLLLLPPAYFSVLIAVLMVLDYLTTIPGMKEYLDARDLPNPQPLVYTKRALAQGEFTELVVHVNNMDAKESVVRFARHAGFPVEKEERRGDEYYITIANNDSPEEGEPAYSKEEIPSPVDLSAPESAGTTLIVGIRGNLENSAAERVFLALPSKDFRFSHLIFLGPALARLCSSEEWRKKTEELVTAGIVAGAEEREAQEVKKDRGCGFPLEELTLFSPADIAEILLASRRVLEF